MFDLSRYSDSDLEVLYSELKSERATRAGQSKQCERCGEAFVGRAGARFCSGRCRMAASRAVSIPTRMRRLNRWVRHDAKRPIMPDGRPASSTDAATWSAYAEAKAATTGDGLGFVLDGDGLGCYDLDHCVSEGRVDPAAARFVAGLDAFYVEVSPSGRGLHAWVESASQPGWRKTIDGLHVEFYTRERFITVTGNVLR